MPKEHAIRSFVQGKILNGKLKAGTPLPSMHELARLWDSNYFTVHKALTPLVKEGLLERHKGLGTFVAETRRKLKTVGLYYGADIISNPQHGYAIQLHRLLNEELKKKGLKIRTWLDPREMKESVREVLPEISWAVEHQEIQALITVMTRVKQIALLQRLPVPIAHFSNGPASHNVYFNSREFLNLAFQRCREKGCRNIALLSSPSLLETSGRKHPWSPAKAYAIFQNLCRQSGLKTQKQWFHLINSGVLSREEERKLILDGYERLIKKGSARPDAVIISPDNNLASLHHSLAQQNRQLDPKLFIVSHRNEPLAFPMPEGPHYIALSLSSVAEKLVQLILQSSRGNPCPSLSADFVETAASPFH